MPAYIPKTRVPVRVKQSGAEQIAGYISLAAQAQFHDGPETLLDVLNAPTRVVPCVRAPDEAVLLLTRLSIDCVEADASVEPMWIKPRTFAVTREERIQVRFADGRRLEGLLQMELPGHLNRPSDFLNAEEDFFPLITPAATVLINKSRISGIRLFEASPEPITMGHGKR